MTRAALASVLVLAALSASACGRRAEVPKDAPSRPAFAASPAASASARRFPLRGVVTAVEPSRSAVILRHEAIPGFMDAMTMPFVVRDDPQVVALLRPGDRVEATLVVDGETVFLERVLTKGFVPTPTPADDRPEPNQGVGVGERVPDFALTDQTGRAVRLSDMRGEPVAVTFVFTRCPIAAACPMTMTKFARLDAALRAKKFGRLLALTVDPENDTVPVLADFGKKIGADPARWKFLTGDPKALARAAESFGVLYYPDRGQIVHTQAVGVVDPQGRLAAVFYGEQWEPETVLQEMEKARKG